MKKFITKILAVIFLALTMTQFANAQTALGLDTCPPNQVNSVGGLCHPPCKDNYHINIFGYCVENCPTGTVQDLFDSTCTQARTSYSRTASDKKCPSGTSQVGLGCYENCRAGYSASGTVCFENCPPGTDWTEGVFGTCHRDLRMHWQCSWIFCWPVVDDGGWVKWRARYDRKFTGFPSECPDTKNTEPGPWNACWTKCKEGFYLDTFTNSCWQSCPTRFDGILWSCVMTKDKYLNPAVDPTVCWYE